MIKDSFQTDFEYNRSDFQNHAKQVFSPNIFNIQFVNPTFDFQFVICQRDRKISKHKDLCFPFFLFFCLSHVYLSFCIKFTFPFHENRRLAGCLTLFLSDLF